MNNLLDFSMDSIYNNSMKAKDTKQDLDLDFNNIDPDLLEKYYNLKKDKCIKILKNMYYIYYHIDPRTNLPVYVGKGTRERAWDFYGRNYKHKKWISELKKEGLRPIIDIGNFFESEKEAYKAEEKDIETLKILGVTLVNMIPGGVGGTAEVCKKSIMCLNNGKTYGSTREAADELNISPKRINDVLKGRKKTCRGYKFRYTKETLNLGPDKERERKSKALRNIPIICLDTNKTYPSATKACKELGVSKSAISGAINGITDAVKGLHFKYVDDKLNVKGSERKEKRKQTSQRYRYSGIECVETKKIYYSIKEIAKEFGVCDSSISMHLNGKRKKIKNHTFRRKQ